MLFKRKSKAKVVNFPSLYPMGELTFSVACSVCKNAGSDKCEMCKCEKQSGFELSGSKVSVCPKSNYCVVCGREIPEGSMVCNNCVREYLYD